MQKISGEEALKSLEKVIKKADNSKPLSIYKIDKYVKLFAVKYGFKEASRYASRGKWSVGINNLASSAIVVAPEVIKNHAGHKKHQY